MVHRRVGLCTQPPRMRRLRTSRGSNLLIGLEDTFPFNIRSTMSMHNKKFGRHNATISPIVTNRNGLLHTLLIEQLNQIFSHKRTAIFHRIGGDTSPTVSEHIRGDEPMSKGFEEGDLAAPVIGGRGEAVEEEEVGFS
jgi:hypothetical protein